MSGKYYVKKLNKNTTSDCFEHAVWSSRIRNKDYTLIGISHPPQGMQQGITTCTSITEFMEFLTEITSQHNNILELGDFNIHIDDLEDADSWLLLDTISAFNLKQLVYIPTHNLGHTFYLIIIENSEYQMEKIILDPYISDHWFITIQLTKHKPKVQQLLTKHRKIPDDIVQEFNKPFSNQPVLETTNLDKATNHFRCEIQRTLNQIAPQKIKKHKTEKSLGLTRNYMTREESWRTEKESGWSTEIPNNRKSIPEKGIISIPCSNTKKTTPSTL